MSESTQALAAAVQGLGKSLGQAVTTARQVGEWAGELSDEAAGHGWFAVAGRMQEAGEALDASAISLEAGQKSCVNAATELGLVDAENSAEEVAGHLSVSSHQLAEAVTEVGEALAKIEEAQGAAAEVGQQAMMEAAANLFELVTELHGQAVLQQGVSASEQAQADAFVRDRTGQSTQDAGSAPSVPTSAGKAGPEPTPSDVSLANPYGGDGVPSTTRPSRAPDPNAQPRGHPAKWTTKDQEETVRGRTRENEAAKLLAEAGYDVEQNPPFARSKNPDFRIEGKIFDNFAPAEVKTLRGIHSVVRNKVKDEQTCRVVINLDDSPITPMQLSAQFSEWPIQDLEEVIAVRRGRIYNVFP